MNDITKNQFYQMPKFLFEEEFKELSNNARVLYSQLKDRHSLSLKNGWINKNNEVYLIYTRENMARMLGCSQPTVRSAITQLKKFKLIEEERLGVNKANRIYLTANDVENVGVKETFIPECKKLSVKNEKKLQSEMKETFSQDCKIISCSNTDSSKTDFNNLSINHQDDKIENYNRLRLNIENQIDYQLLKESYPHSNVIEDILEIIVDIMTSNATTVRVNQENKNIDVVKSMFIKLDYGHIEYVLKSFRNQTNKANNVRAYLITTLYNAPMTMNVYYNNLVNHDMANIIN